jgi:4-hydroxy-3-polyprenylbenzoate decarboxylase
MTVPNRVIVGLSGASGASIGIRIVELLARSDGYEVHLVVSSAAERTLLEEVGPDALPYLRSLVTHVHDYRDIGASIASGSFRTEGMIVAPCSIRTLTAIAGSHLDSLLVRAADVQLKERRRLVLMVRESPLHLGHLRAMAQVAEIGAIIAPPVPAFYLKPKSLAEAIDYMARRAIGLLDLHGDSIGWREWAGTACRQAHESPTGSGD